MEKRIKLFSRPEERKIKLFSADSEELGFQRVFSETTDPLELKLKEFSGRELDLSEYEKEFSDYDLIEKGYAEKSENSVKIISSAFPMSRLFSTITITIADDLGLDKDIVCGKCNKEEVISRLHERLSPAAIMILKQAHGIPVEEDQNTWIKDSGIEKDIDFEFKEDDSKPLPEFKRFLEERYNDAPSDILDILKNKGIIRVDGEVVKIIK